MNIDLERKKLDLRKVETAMAELEFKILERLSDIERIKEQIQLQIKTVGMLKQQIESMEG